jgi:16S rRNA (guanine527-N7)-methyltransferase
MTRRANLTLPVALGVASPQQRLWDADGPIWQPTGVSHETFERLKLYVGLVQKWTKSINLVSKRDHDLIWPRHVLDSLRLLPLIPKGISGGVDLGSGAGFPGLILALATGIPFDLVESDRRKAAFLVEAQRVTGAPVKVHCARIEDLRLPLTPLVTARALAPLATLLAYAQRLLAPGGVALFLKGAQAAQEIAEAERYSRMQNWHMQIDRFDDPHYPKSAILAVTGLTHV